MHKFCGSDEIIDENKTMKKPTKAANPHILTINGGSSSIKFALFVAGDTL
jgi:hypothetical protein